MNKKNEKTTRITLEELKQNKRKSLTDWKRVGALSDKQIEEAVRDDPDAAPLVDHSFWDDADIFYRTEKVEVHMYLDKHIVDFFKQGGRGYQTRINSALRKLVNQWNEKHS